MAWSSCRRPRVDDLHLSPCGRGRGFDACEGKKLLGPCGIVSARTKQLSPLTPALSRKGRGGASKDYSSRCTNRASSPLHPWNAHRGEPAPCPRRNNTPC